jgi:hypothetical protein
MSLARLYCGRNEVEAARVALEPVYRRFTEGFASANLIAAKALLGALK